MNLDGLKKFPGFASLTDSKLEEIARHTELKEYAAGQLILQEGEFADAFYIILEGDICVFTIDDQGKKQILARLQKDEFFGEQAFSSSVSPRRTASVEAILPSKLYRIPRQVLLDLDKKSAKLKQIIHERFREFISKKASQVAEKINETLEFSQFLKSTQKLDKGEVLYYQGDPALHFYILLSGAIELKGYDETKNLTDLIELGLGEMFGNQLLEEKTTYPYTAVAKEASEIIVIPVEKLKKYSDQAPQLLEYGQKIEKQRLFGHYGKAIQFRGQYLDMPAFFTVIFLTDGREIVCSQVINSNIISIQTTGATSTKTVQYSKDDYQLQLHLSDTTLIGLSGLGLWDNLDKLMDRIVQKQTLTQGDLDTFQKTGRLETSLSTLAGDKTFVCTCMRVTRNEIESMIKGGTCTFANIRDKTRASTVCGSCGPTIREMLGSDAWIPCRVVPSTRHNAKTQTFRLEPLSPISNLFTPGQHIIIRAMINNLPINRSYTLTSVPEDKNFEVTIKLEEGGQFSPWLFQNASQNPLVHVSGPYGDFVLTKNTNPVLCFAGGIGITPFVAFFRYLARHHSSRELYIDYSARNLEDFSFREEIEQCLKSMPKVQVHFRATSKQGKLSEEQILHTLQRLSKPEIYICGPAQFEDSIVKSLKKAHVAHENIHTERFIQAGAAGQQLITF